MKNAFTLLLLSSLFFNSCSVEQKGEAEINFEYKIRKKLIESYLLCEKLECQTTFSKEASIYSKLTKQLHEQVANFIDTSFVNIPTQDTSYSKQLSKFNQQYHSKINETVKSVNYKIFHELDLNLFNSTKFKIDSNETEYPKKYYLTCIKLLDDHLNIVKGMQPKFSHDPCEKK